MSDVVTSWLRTVVPGLYSTAITALLTWAAVEVPWLISVLDALHIDPLAPGTVLAVVALVLAAWHALWRRVEPHLPDWLTRIVLGSAASPVYIRSIRTGPGIVAGRVLSDSEAAQDITRNGV
jgi:hypothetical protein